MRASVSIRLSRDGLPRQAAKSAKKRGTSEIESTASTSIRRLPSYDALATGTIQNFDLRRK
jgi:hypothetical protein